MTFAPTQNLFTQPDAPADKTLYVGRNPPPNTFGFVHWHGNPVGSMLTTDSAPLPGSDPNFVSEEAEWPISPGIAVFAQPGAVLGFSMELEVPFARRTGNSIPYVEQYVFLQDPAGLGFWLGGTVYDIRGQRIISVGVQAPERGTGVPIVTGLVGADCPFSTNLGGEAFQATPWTGFKQFIFGVSAANVAAAIAGIKASDPAYAGMTDDPTKIVVTLANLNVEIARRNGTARLGYTPDKLSLDLYWAS